jgi:hypothetical protein
MAMTGEPLTLLQAFWGATCLEEVPSREERASATAALLAEHENVDARNRHREACASRLIQELLSLAPVYRAKFRCDTAQVEDAIGRFFGKFFPRGADVERPPQNDDDVVRYLRRGLRNNLIDILECKQVAPEPSTDPHTDLAEELAEARVQLYSEIVPGYAASLSPAVGKRLLTSFAQLRDVHLRTMLFETVVAEATDVERWKLLRRDMEIPDRDALAELVSERFYQRYSRFFKDIKAEIARLVQTGVIDADRGAALAVVLEELRLRDNKKKL